MVSNSPSELEDAESLTALGSPAEGYLIYLRHLGESSRDAGLGPEPQSQLDHDDESFELCESYSTSEECLTFTDFSGDEGLIESLYIEDRPLEERLVADGESTFDGPAGSEVTFISAYENGAGTHLLIGYELRSGSSGMMMPWGSYRNPSGRQSQSEMTQGTPTLAPDSMSYYVESIPGGELGGEHYLELIDDEGFSMETIVIPVGAEDPED
ncbi:hypothetical protein [Nesterenkonia pannonica]|uniref:hypothetical protein n=1 Tax=Nesterenkonia pannonica TaxID=1548602 RepID=UPI00216488BE|nr:hypothetical protein [Nesterenkonia pannonica]